VGMRALIMKRILSLLLSLPLELSGVAFPPLSSLLL
jgi:hypothetical protein